MPLAIAKAPKPVLNSIYFVMIDVKIVILENEELYFAPKSVLSEKEQDKFPWTLVCFNPDLISFRVYNANQGTFWSSVTKTHHFTDCGDLSGMFSLIGKWRKWLRRWWGEGEPHVGLSYVVSSQAIHQTPSASKPEMSSAASGCTRELLQTQDRQQCGVNDRLLPRLCSGCLGRVRSLPLTLWNLSVEIPKAAVAAAPPLKCTHASELQRVV